MGRVTRLLYKMWTVFVFTFSLAIVAVTHADEFTLVKLASVPGGSNCMNQGTVVKYDIADCKAECRKRPKCDTMNYCPKTGGGCGTCVLKSCNSGRPVTNGNYKLGGSYRGFATWAKDTYILRKPSTRPGMSGCRGLATIRGKFIWDCKRLCQGKPGCDTFNYCDKGAGCTKGDCQLKSCNGGKGGVQNLRYMDKGYKGWMIWTKRA